MNLREAIPALPGTWVNPLSEVFQHLPARLLGDWELYDSGFYRRPSAESIASHKDHRREPIEEYPSKIAKLAYLPDSIEPTDWIVLTNGIFITYNDQVTDSAGKVVISDGGYRIVGPLIEPTVTTSPKEIAESILAQVETVASATEFNAEIERLYQDEKRPAHIEKGAGDHPLQRSPLLSISRVGPTSVERLAEEFGTYYNLTVGDDWQVGACLSQWYDEPPVEEVKVRLSGLIDKYNQQRARKGEDHSHGPPEQWVDYPKEATKRFLDRPR